MSMTKAILTAGLLALTATALADPTIEVRGGGARAGQPATLTFWLKGDGTTPVGGAALVLKTNQTTSDVTLTTTVAASAPWQVPTGGVNLDASGVLTVLLASNTNVSGDSKLATVTVTQNASGFKATKIDMVPGDPSTGQGTSLTNGDTFDTIYVTNPISTTVTSGPRRDLGGVSNNGISVGPGKMIAAVAGTGASANLWLLNGADLADAANWAGGKPIGAAISPDSRPAFGSVGGADVVAVGTTAGRVVIMNVGTGAIVTDATAGGSVHGAPAIFDGITHVAYIDGTDNKPKLGSVAGPGAATVTDLGLAGGDLTIGSPSIYSDGSMLLSTSKGVISFAVGAGGALTPRTVAAATDDVNTAPVVVNGSEAIVASASGKVYKIAMATGNTVGGAGTVTEGPALPLSSPFAAAGQVFFGTNNGKVLAVSPGAVGADLSLGASTGFGTGKANSPVYVNGSLYVGDNLGRVARVGGEAVDLGIAVGLATTATGQVAGTDQVVVNLTNGEVVALPVL